MAISFLDDKAIYPSVENLQVIIGKLFTIWNEIIDFVKVQYPKIIEQWSFGGKNYGWGFRLKDKKRAIIYLIPCEKYFKAAFVYGEKATNDALNSDISIEIKDIIKNAKVFAEGRGFRIDVTNENIFEDIKKLILIKMKY